MEGAEVTTSQRQGQQRQSSPMAGRSPEEVSSCGHLGAGQGQGNGCDGSQQLSRNWQRAEASQRQGPLRPETAPACKGNSCQSFRNRWKPREKSLCLAEHSCLSTLCSQEGSCLPSRPRDTHGCHASRFFSTPIPPASWF